MPYAPIEKMFDKMTALDHARNRIAELESALKDIACHCLGDSCEMVSRGNELPIGGCPHRAALNALKQ
jgi:hypothetical protein